jgi:hypothetical protein
VMKAVPDTVRRNHCLRVRVGNVVSGVGMPFLPVVR